MQRRGSRARVAVIATALCVCGSARVVDAEPVATLRAHVLARTAYGPDAWTLARIADLGVDAYLEEQLHPEEIPDGALEARLAGYPTLAMELAQLRADYVARPSQALRELQRAKLLRCVYSHRQLEQLLVDFWFDYFNVFGGDGFAMLAVGPYERRAIRPHVLGSFHALLRAVARNGAMLFYLDGDLNRKDGYVYDGKRYGLNENYARELLELHTVGSGAGYTQADVIDVARSFTGWTNADPRYAAVDGFYFSSPAHDDAPKRVLGLALPAGGGVRDGLGVLEHLAAHPATAARVCRALVVRFVSERPPPRLVLECAQVFRATDGDLRAVMRALLFSPEFRDPAFRGAKVKRPLVFVASLLRATGAQVGASAVDAQLDQLSLLGEPLYLARPPTGYPDDSFHWSAGGTLLVRADLAAKATLDPALAIAWGPAPRADADLVGALAARLLTTPMSAATRNIALARLAALPVRDDAARQREAAALLLASPEFMRH